MSGSSVDSVERGESAFDLCSFGRHDPCEAECEPGNHLMKRYLAGSAAALALLGCGGAASAASFTPTVVGASSNYVGYPASDAVDSMQFTDWAAGSTGNGSYINFDLGSNVALTSINLVDRETSGGPNGTYFGGTTDFTTQFSLTSYSDATFSTATGTQTFNKPLPTSNPVPVGQASEFAFTGSTSLQGEFFRYTVLAAQGANPGLNNVSFQGNAISAAPEPGAWALMLGGVGAMGLMLRRRRTAARIA